ncbi:MAG: DUF4342 domain-containing protein [Erysipelotrichaceae bacterium]|nr:DUF4342 domain-containing protein [Erysipelotrichaceae bacterium]
MNYTIQDVDQVIERTGCSYAQAKEALDHSDGIVIDAIIYLENKDRSTFGSFFRNFSEDTERNAETIMEKIKEVIKQGDATKLEVRDNHGKKVAGVSLNGGAAIGALTLISNTAPLLIIAGLVTRFGMNYRFAIVRSDGSETIL